MTIVTILLDKVMTTLDVESEFIPAFRSNLLTLPSNRSRKVREFVGSDIGNIWGNAVG